MVSFSLLGLQHPEPNGSRRATPTSTFQHRPGHPRTYYRNSMTSSSASPVTPETCRSNQRNSSDQVLIRLRSSSGVRNPRSPSTRHDSGKEKVHVSSSSLKLRSRPQYETDWMMVISCEGKMLPRPAGNRRLVTPCARTLVPSYLHPSESIGAKPVHDGLGNLIFLRCGTTVFWSRIGAKMQSWVGSDQ